MPYLRLRWWSKPLSKSDSSTENDSDTSSSPERLKRRVSLHITAHPADRTPTPIINNTRSTSRLSHDDILNEKFSAHHLEPPVEATDKVVGLLRWVLGSIRTGFHGIVRSLNAGSNFFFSLFGFHLVL